MRPLGMRRLRATPEAPPHRPRGRRPTKHEADDPHAQRRRRRHHRGGKTPIHRPRRAQAKDHSQVQSGENRMASRERDAQERLAAYARTLQATIYPAALAVCTMAKHNEVVTSIRATIEIHETGGILRIEIHREGSGTIRFSEALLENKDLRSTA